MSSSSQSQITLKARTKGLSINLNRYVLIVILASGILTSFILLFPMRTFMDTGIFLETGRRIVEGQRLYVDIEDVNLPTFHYFGALLVALSRIAHINPIILYNLSTLGLLAYSCTVTIVILRQKLGKNDPLGVYIIPCMLLIHSIGLLPSSLFGEREHFILLIAVAWFILRWNRWEGIKVNIYLAFTTGFLACIGASIKPYFIPMFLIGDVYWVLTKRDLRALLQPEVYGALCFGLLYIGYFLLIEPEILTYYFHWLSAGMASAYFAWGGQALSSLFFSNLAGPLSILLAAASWTIPPSGENKLWSMARPFGLLLLCGILGFIIQQKGWPYHRIAFDGCAFIFLGLLMHYSVTRITSRTSASKDGHTHNNHFSLIIVSSLVLVLSLVSLNGISSMLFSPMGSGSASFNALIEAHSKPGDPVVVVDTRWDPAYPSLQQVNRTQATRSLLAHLIAFAYYDAPDISEIYTARHHVPEYARQYLNDLVHTIQERHPPLIFIHAGQCDKCPFGLDLYAYLQARRVLADVVDPSYNVLDNTGYYIVFVRR